MGVVSGGGKWGVGVVSGGWGGKWGGGVVSGVVVSGGWGW